MSTLKTIFVGVLDIQGSVEEHLAMLKKLDVNTVSVKTKKDLDKVDGLIIPGGESTTIGKLMKKYGLDDAICKRASLAIPLVVWGTCAGAILLAKKITNSTTGHLRLMNIEIERNAYGSQLESFQAPLNIPIIGEKPFPAIFIRAPKVNKTSKSVNILAEYKGSPVMLEENNFLATMFHPELTSDTRVHEYFIKLIKRYAKTN